MVFKRGSLRIGALLAAFVTGALTLVGAPAAQAETLRVCADPDNMPFSREAGEPRGIYIEVAEKVAEKLSMPIEYVWWLTYSQRRALRNTVLKNDCDAVFALPGGKGWGMRGLARTDPFMSFSYALIAPEGIKVEKLTDLKGKRIGVQFQTNPHVLLSTLDAGYDFTTMLTTDELMSALHDGAVDVVFLWGPVAGYEMARQANKGQWRVIPLAGAEVEGTVAVGVRKDHDTLRQRINGALAELGPEIKTIAAKYHVPQGEALHFSEFDLPYGPGAKSGKGAAPAGNARGAAQGLAAGDAGKPVQVAAAGSAKASDAGDKPAGAKDDVAAATPAAGGNDAALAEAGQVKFNDVCSHCHGTNGASPIRVRDLRRLKARYEDDWINVAQTTIHKGRPDYGMPTWEGVLSEDQITEIIAFLKTIQPN